MRKLGVVLAIVVLGVSIFFMLRKDKEEEVGEVYQYDVISKGDIENVVSSTGSLDPVSSVNVGTQVSGRISRIYVDFNDQVKEGTLLAVLDTTNLAEQVKDGESRLASAKAKKEKADFQYSRAKELREKDLISDTELITAKTEMETARADYLSAQSSLKRARQNLDYAYIYAPIDGIVIDRQVEEGQTVAASMQAPVLFTVANDLTEMEMLAEVDESDIGLIKKGQKVRFEVPAYPEKKFTGVVKQVRLQPSIVQNVVTYSVVISAENKDKLLLPGMTSVVDFIIEKAENVYRVPLRALQLKPNREMLSVLKSKRKNREKNGGDKSNKGLLWFQGDHGGLEYVLVEKGISDGKYVEIKAPAHNLDNKKIIVNALNGKAGLSSGNMMGSPFGPPMRGRGR